MFHSGIAQPMRTGQRHKIPDADWSDRRHCPIRGNTNVLDGPHWVAAFEKALQSDDVQCWDSQTKRTGPEHLVLLRFPAQKVVVVLPAKAAAEFQRTDGIHLTDPEAGH
jgi:hypothetical protein